MTEKAAFYAGKKALEMIRDGGFSQASVKVIAGAAGGPKWIVLSGLDRYIFSHWLNGRTEPLFMIGSSIGAYRFTAAGRKNPEEAIDRLLDDYIHQAYSAKPSPQEITDKGAEIVENAMGTGDPADVLSHPFLRLNVMAVRCKGPTGSPGKPGQIAGFLAAMIGNAASRNSLGFFFERTLFHDPRDKAPFHTMNRFPITRVPLTRNNLKPAVVASGAIPIVMSGVSDIPGAKKGMYRDGGIVDYHLDIPYGVNDGIVLFPHYTDRIVPGWLDKNLTYRKPSQENTENLLMVCPSRSFINGLPYGKIPDRNDFVTFTGKDRDRFDYWITVAEKSRELAEDFHEAVESGTLGNRVKPLP